MIQLAQEDNDNDDERGNITETNRTEESNRTEDIEGMSMRPLSTFKLPLIRS